MTSRQDWFRNTEWNESIAQAFEEKLRRARNKSQYLRIQASTLSKLHPAVALALLERYFSLGEKFDWPQAYCDQAAALLALGRIDEAISAFENALQREAEFPNLQTQAYVELPLLIATLGQQERFDQAIQILQRHQSRPAFPVERFMWHATLALIAKCRGDSASASESACHALVEANRKNSDFRFHPAIGLVPQRYQGLVEELIPLCGKPVS